MPRMHRATRRVPKRAGLAAAIGLAQPDRSDLARAAEPDGTFTYTFFKATGRA